MNEREVGYQRVVHVLPEEGSRTKDIEGDAIRSVDKVVSTSDHSAGILKLNEKRHAR